MASLLAGFAASVMMVRYLGAAHFGVYSFVFAYVGFLAIIADMSIGTIVLREISKENTQKDLLLGNAIILKLFLSLVAFFLSCSIAKLLAYSFNTKLYIYIASLNFFGSFIYLNRLVFQAQLEMRYPVVADFLSMAVRLCLILLLIAKKSALLWFIVVEVVSNIPGIVFILCAARGFLKPRFKVVFALWGYILKEAWPLALSSVFALVFLRIDQLLLYRMQGTTVLGLYAPAVKLSELFNALPLALMISVFPLLAKYHGESERVVSKLYQVCLKYLLAFIIPIAAWTTLSARGLFLILYGKDFLPSAPAFIILMWAEIFLYIGILNNRLLVSMNKQRIDFLFTATAATISLALNLLLIPRFGFVGAAVASLFAYMVGPMMNCLVKVIQVYARKMWGMMLKPLCASVGMMAVIFPLRASLVFSAIAGITVYVMLMFFLRGFSWDEIRALTTTTPERILA